MIEVSLYSYLNKVMDVPVFSQHQEEEPERFVIFEKVGSGFENGINRASFAIQSYGGSLFEAASLNDEVKEAMKAMDQLDCIGSVSLDSDYNFPDMETKRDRYQAVFDIYY